MKQKNDLNWLFVDLDGTLISTDTLWESLLLFVKKHPWRVFLLFLWVFKGKRFFKDQIARRVIPDPAALPYRQEVMEKLRNRREEGKQKIILATAAHQKIANAVAEYLGLFDDVLATDSQVNLLGEEKLKRMQTYAKGQPFEYWGDSSPDLAVWQQAAAGLAVAPSKSLQKELSGLPQVEIWQPEKTPVVKALLKAIRVHQWSKNLLLFVPAVMAHTITNLAGLFHLLTAFLAFSLTASSVYVINDLLDLPTDRRHSTKKRRPFAAGTLSIKTGLLLAPLLLIAAVTISLLYLRLSFLVVLLLYMLITTSYSFFLKRKMVIDVITLAGLYSFRIFAGAVAATVPVSSWLLAFSMFFFLSLALMKRQVDLLGMEGSKIKGRGYQKADQRVVLAGGLASGFTSLLVLSLYINADHVQKLYAQPLFLWLLIPLFLYWITRMWILTERGEMTEDPIVFTIKDKISLMVFVLMAVVLALAIFTKSELLLEKMRLIQ